MPPTTGLDMKVSAVSRLVAVVTVLMLVAMGLVIFRALGIQDGVSSSEEYRLRSLRLANELFQSSEDLTRMARSYVTTGDPVYERRYFEILDIRNGKRPRPKDYAQTYWHLSGIVKATPSVQGTAVPLQELMRREGFREQEFKLLRESQANSDQLVNLEKQAFAAVKGLYDDGHGAFTVRRAPDRDFAIGLLYGERYIDEKAGIMAPIQRFVDAIDEPTKAELNILQARLQNQIVLLMALVAIALIGVTFIITYTRRAVLRPLERLGRQAEEISVGNYASRFDIHASNELAMLGAHFNHMAQSIERDIAGGKLAEQALARANEDLEAREALLKQILDTSSVAIFLVDMEGRITHANQRMAEMFERPLAELVGKEYVELVHPSEREAGRWNMLALLASEIRLVDLERRYWRADDTEFLGHLTGKRFYDVSGAERGLLGVIADITARKMAELREQHHNRVLKMLAEKAPLASVLDAIARDVETINPGMLCSIFLLDDEGKHLRHGAAPSLPEFYNQAIDSLAIGPGIGSCGSAAFTGERVIVEDIETHPSWVPFLDLARRAALGACWSEPIRSAQGKVLGTFAIYHHHPRLPSSAELQLIEDEARLAALAIDKTAAESRLQLAASVFTHAREGIMITDAAAAIVEVNDTFTHITGYSREEAMGQNPRMLQSGRQGPEYYAAMWQALIEKGHWYGETWNRRKNGEVYPEMLTISAVRDATGKTQNYVALFTDITPLKEHEQHLEHIAHYDALTNLPNRVLLADRLQQAIAQSQRRGQSLGVVYLDLDGFKAVNDLHGHDVGDELLIAIAQRMKKTLREGDTLARIGGDEFVVVLVDLELPQDCEPILARLLQAAADPVVVRQQALHVSASIGVTLYPQDGADADLLLRHADQAMYLAKLAGKNRYHLFDVAQDAAAKTQHESLERIRRALDRREFVLHYQPKVNMKTGAVIGAEALIRWQHPERGLLPPAAFLPIIEDHQVSVELGEWVIDSALTQMTEWRAVGLDIPVSVNVGARQLQQGDFVRRLSDLLAAHPEVRPHCLELEILETSALEEMALVSELMHACRALGVRFALDDFGTGYSSLTYLKRLPVELLKIDQSFVRDILDDPEDLAIIEGVMGLATAFRRQVIAEGVETVAHGELLLPLGCELAQGYGIARPMPAAELPDWVATWRPDDAWTAWRDRPFNRDDRMTVFVEVEHRHWLRAIEIFLAGDRDAAPPPEAHDGHFGHWHDTDGRVRYGEHPAFPVVLAMHGRLHALGRKLVELHVRGRQADAQARLAELHLLRDELIGRLRRLVRGEDES